MNNFIEEISNIAKLPFNEILKDYKLIMISNKILYLSNYTKILDYSKSKIIFKVYKSKIEILGENMQISQINKKEIVIKGTIISCNLGEQGDNGKSK